MILREVIGENIRSYRKQQNLSQETLAFKADVHENYLSLVERGQANISVDTLEKIAKVLKLPVYLLIIQDSIKSTITINPL